jgi:hypothetical protein
MSNAVPTFNKLNSKSLTSCDVCVCSKEIDRAVDEGWQRRRLPQDQVEGFKGFGLRAKVRQQPVRKGAVRP